MYVSDIYNKESYRSNVHSSIKHTMCYCEHTIIYTYIHTNPCKSSIGQKDWHIDLKSTNEESVGSISRKQWIGAKRGAMINISQELIGSSPNTSKSHTRKLQRGASRARRQLPICDHKKVRYLRCDGLTLTSRDSIVTCCKNCGCILPSSWHEP